MPAIVETPNEAAIAYLLRRYDRDRYLLSLFVPAAARASVQAIYAFNYEIARIRETVSEPLLGKSACNGGAKASTPPMRAGRYGVTRC